MSTQIVNLLFYAQNKIHYADKEVDKTPTPYFFQLCDPHSSSQPLSRSPTAPSPLFISIIDYGYGQHLFSNLGDLTIGEHTY